MDISGNKFYEVMYLYGNEEKMENEASDKKKDIKRGVQDGIPIALGYLSVSFAFGIMAVSAGLTPWQAILISVANVTSAGQFAGVEIMAACGGLVEMALTQLVINIRYALMSLSLAQKVDDTFKKPTRMAVSFCVTDEIFAVSVSRNKTVSKYYMLGIISVSYIGWIAGTAFGALLGGILPAVISDALGIAIYGMFLAIILPAARDDSRFLKVIIIAVVLSCMFRWIPVLNKVSSGFVIIICAVAASAVGAWLYPIDVEEGN